LTYALLLSLKHSSQSTPAWSGFFCCHTALNSLKCWFSGANNKTDGHWDENQSGHQLQYDWWSVGC